MLQPLRHTELDDKKHGSLDPDVNKGGTGSYTLHTKRVPEHVVRT